METTTKTISLFQIKEEQKMHKITTFIVVIWTTIFLISLGWNLLSLFFNLKTLAKQKANQFYQKDLMYFKWNINSKGLYGEIGKKLRPNPHLNIKDKNLTVSGKKLTYISPAYMIQQIYNLSKKGNMEIGKIVSINPINPRNKADKWEKKAIHKFKKGEKEYSSLVKIDNLYYTKFMKPLYIRKSCLQCHNYKNYKIGHIGGGIRVLIPMQPYWDIFFQKSIYFTIGHTILWLIGLCGIFFGKKQIQKISEERNDITDQLLKNQREQRKTLQKLTDERNLFTPGPTVVFKWRNKENWPVEYVSSNVQEVLGYTVDDFRSGAVSYFQIISKEYMDRVSEEITSYTKKRVKFFHHKPYEIITKDNKKIIVDVYITILKNEFGRITHYLGYIIDITMLKETKERLRESEDKYRLIVESSNDPIVIRNKDKYIYFNNAFSRLTGYDYDELYSQKCSQLLPAYEIIPSIDTKKLKKKWDQVEFKLTCKNGTQIEIQATSNIVKYRKNFVYLSILKDITKQKKILKALQNKHHHVTGEGDLVTICASCKDIYENKKKIWIAPETYINDLLFEINFSHGICPNCLKKLYPDFYERKYNKNKTLNP